MLQVKNLNITHKKDLRILLQDFSCVLNAGDKAAIIGEEGDGKSTLLKWIFDPDIIEDYTEAAGERIVSGERLAYLPQELPGEYAGKSVYEFFAEEPSFYERTPKELGKLAKDFNISREFFYGEQLMETLSGGEKVKAQLMRLLLSDPTVLLLDEPSNDIDMETLEWLEKMINNWEHFKAESGGSRTIEEENARYKIHGETVCPGRPGDDGDTGGGKRHLFQAGWQKRRGPGRKGCYRLFPGQVMCAGGGESPGGKHPAADPRPGKDLHCGEQRSGEDHAFKTDGGGTSGQGGYPCGIYAPEL